MPVGSFDLDSRAPLSEPAVPVFVCRYDGAGNYFHLPNVACYGVQWHGGSDPPTARFGYLLDELTAAQGFPASIDEVLPLGAVGDYVVQPDDRLVVIAYTPDGDRRFLFDGHAQIPQGSLSPGSEAATFVAVGVHARCSDVPVFGRIQRDAWDPQSGDEVYTHLPPRFNPTNAAGKMVGNATPKDYDVDQSDATKRYPVFLDEALQRSPDPRASWTLSGLARYLMATENKAEAYVDNPDFDLVDAYLKSLTPTKGTSYDPNDPSTYTAADITIRDVDANNRTWPEALVGQLTLSGFLFCWTTVEGPDGNPLNSLNIFRLDQKERVDPKVVWLDEQGSDIDPARNQVAAFQLARDLNACVNAFAIETLPKRVELSVILAPLFTPTLGDETAANRLQFHKSNLAQADATVKRAYRWYGADEAGDGHYAFSPPGWVTGIGSFLDLSPVFPKDKKGKRTFLVRRRKGAHELITRDSLNHPYRASLAYSFDYAGDAPGVWDGTGTWNRIGGGWKLLENQLGIEVDTEDPEAWTAGAKKPQIRGITWLANPPAGSPNNGKPPVFRLTTVIDDDFCLDASALNRPSSPTRFARLRRVDARDHFRQEKVHPSSIHFAQAAAVGGLNTDSVNSLIVRDDTPAATAHARALRSAHEVPPLAGSIALPFVTNAYQIGDRIKAIAGRDISLRSNLTGDGEAPFYPMVVGVSWDFAGDHQQTTLQLSDLRARPR